MGRSLGIDPVSTKSKTCSFDCVYCQLGHTVHPLTDRKEFVTVEEMVGELKKLELPPLDYVTFSGMAEPTLAKNLGELVTAVKEILSRPVAILTNSSLIIREDVRRDLTLMDLVVAKIDAPNEKLFRQINRPFTCHSLKDIIEGVRRFREEFGGMLALQMMFIEANAGYAKAMAAIARSLSPDEVQINTPLRPSPVPPLSPERIAAVEKEFHGLKIISVYRAARPEVSPLDEAETLRRRPQSETRGGGTSCYEEKVEE